MENFHNKQYPFRDGEVITEGNFSQRLPYTIVAAGVKGLVINGGNHTNCLYPDDAIINRENVNIHQISYCKHLHPEFEELPDEGTDLDVCEHVVIENGEPLSVEIDGEIIGYVRQDKAL
jgi:hypothetical protein